MKRLRDLPDSDDEATRRAAALLGAIPPLPPLDRLPPEPVRSRHRDRLASRSSGSLVAALSARALPAGLLLLALATLAAAARGPAWWSDTWATFTRPRAGRPTAPSPRAPTTTAHGGTVAAPGPPVAPGWPAGTGPSGSIDSADVAPAATATAARSRAALPGPSAAAASLARPVGPAGVRAAVTAGDARSPPPPAPPSGAASPTAAPSAPAARTAEVPPLPAGDPALPLPSLPADQSAFLDAAIRALRVDHDPRFAGVLLDEYRRRFPAGPLLEEAMGLAIEAASARADGTAREAATRYLRRYPRGGRYVAAARATLGSDP